MESHQLHGTKQMQDDSNVSFELHAGLHGGSSEVLLFQGLVTHSIGTFILACILLVLISFGLELAKYYLSKYEKKMMDLREEKVNLISNADSLYSSVDLDNKAGLEKSKGLSNVDKTSDETVETQPPGNDSDAEIQIQNSRNWKSWLLIGSLYASTYLASTFLMLIAMTYNIYLIISLSVGVTAGRLLTLYLKYKVT